MLVWLFVISTWMFPKIGVPPKWMVYNGKPYQNWWFGGTPIFGNTHIDMYKYWFYIQLLKMGNCSSIGAAPLHADPPLLTTCHNEKDILSELQNMRGLGGCHIGVIWADSIYTHTHTYISRRIHVWYILPTCGCFLWYMDPIQFLGVHQYWCKMLNSHM